MRPTGRGLCKGRRGKIQRVLPGYVGVRSENFRLVKTVINNHGTSLNINFEIIFVKKHLPLREGTKKQ